MFPHIGSLAVWFTLLFAFHISWPVPRAMYTPDTLAHAGNYSKNMEYCKLFRRAAAPHHEYIRAPGLPLNSKVAKEQNYTKCKPSINTFSCWGLCEMITFCFLKGIYPTAYQVITASELHHSQVHYREHQYKGIRTTKDDCDNYYVGCSSCLIKQSVSHSFRAT